MPLSEFNYDSPLIRLSKVAAVERPPVGDEEAGYYKLWLDGGEVIEVDVYDAREIADFITFANASDVRFFNRGS